MKSIVFKTTVATLLASSVLVASGWRLPESSSRSVALSGAYIANSHGADAAYYNPANMSFNENVAQMELDLTYLKLPSMKYTEVSARNTALNGYFNGQSEATKSIIPTFFLVSKDYGNGVRYGLSLVVPGGLSRKWTSPYQKTFAEEFTLEIIELNPAVSYKVSDSFSIGAGLRVIYSEGVVKSDGAVQVTTPVAATIRLQRDMEGDTIEYGYNLALAYKPNENSNLSATYRSNVDLGEEGSARLSSTSTFAGYNSTYNGSAGVIVPLPAVLTVAYAHKIHDTTIEFEFDRTYWSKYKNLDFSYSSSLAATPLASFDNSIARDWQDTNAFRIGITHEFSDTFTGMIGWSKDGNAIPDKAVSFESPDYNSNTYSFGFDYEISAGSSVGFGYLYSTKKDRTVSNTRSGQTYLDGTLSDAKAHIFTLAYRMTF